MLYFDWHSSVARGRPAGSFELRLLLETGVLVGEDSLSVGHVLDELLDGPVSARRGLELEGPVLAGRRFRVFLCLVSVRHFVHGSFSIDLVAEEVSKLIEANFGVPVCVDSTDDSKDFPIN